MSDKLIIRLSQSALSTSGCILNFYRTVIEGYKKTPKASIVYGSAVHKFFDVMFKTDSNLVMAVSASKKTFAIEKEFEEKKPWLSEERHMLSTCSRVWADYISEDSSYEVIKINDIPCSEFNFSIKYYEDDYIIVYLEGTLDNLGQIKGGCYAIRDFKTTGAWNSKEYFKRYELSKQLMFYCMICKMYAETEPESTLGKIGATKMGAFITGIFIKEKHDEIEVIKSDVFSYSDKQLADFRRSVDWFIGKISRYIQMNECNQKEGILNGTCERKWGYCDYFNICKTNEQVGQLILKRDFKVVPFNPLAYEGAE